jgi:putative acetyltransferase
LSITYQIHLDDLRGPEIAVLLQEHLDAMHEHSPPESVHALNLDALRKPAISFWTAWDGANLAGCGALRELDPGHGEIKSMRTSTAYLRKGVAAQILDHVIAVAKQRGYHRLSLETGSHPPFAPARALYARFGFVPCPPFGDYFEDQLSICMTMLL